MQNAAGKKNKKKTTGDIKPCGSFLNPLSQKTYKGRMYPPLNDKKPLSLPGFCSTVENILESSFNC